MSFEPRARRFVVLLAALAASVVAGEALVRIFADVPSVHPLWVSDPASAYRRSTNPLLRYELKSGFRRQLEPGLTTTNAQGLRDRERALAKPAGWRRILLVGDSVVELINYLGDDDTTARRLEERLALDNIEVINLGTAGYCTLAEIELLATRGLLYDPDVVVVVFVGNDFQNFNPEHTLEAAIERPWLVKQLFQRSELFRLAALELDLWSFRVEVDPARRNQQALGENNVVTGLRRLRELAEAQHFMPLVAIWPAFTENAIVDGPWMPDGSGELIVERLARIFGIPSARLSPFFPPVPDPRARYTARADGLHPSVAGAKLAAAGLEAMLAELPGRLPPAGRDDIAAVEAARRSGAAPPAPLPPEQQVFFVLMQQYRVAEAEAYLRRLLDADPDNHFARHRLGAELLRRGEVVEATRELEHAARIRPDDVETRYRLAVAYAQQGKWQEARAEYERVLSLEPGHRGALADLEQLRR